MKQKLKSRVLAGALLMSAGAANASLVQNGTIDLGAQGFGNAPRLLTIQQEGTSTRESGAIGISGGIITGLTPGISDALVYSGNGMTNLGGNTVSPLSDNQKFGIPSGVTGGPESFAAVAAPIPEPETYAMMLAGLGLLGFARRRRERQDK